MTAPAPSRRRAREVALQTLYQLDLVDSAAPLFLERFVAGRLRAEPLIRFSQSLVDGVRKHLEEIDAAIEARAENWRLARMTVVDRSLLRMATFEILHTDVPVAVAADEAVELAKRYGAESSPRFVAGILAKLIADRADETAGTTSAESTSPERT